MAEKEPLINAQKAAKILGVHYTTAIRWATKGHPTAGTPIKILGQVGGQYVIDRNSVERLAKELDILGQLDRKRREAASA